MIILKILCIAAALAGTILHNMTAIGSAVAAFMVLDLHEGGWRSQLPAEPPSGTPSVRVSHVPGRGGRKN